MKGAEFPDQWVVRGNHHDAWVNGATDPISGKEFRLSEFRGKVVLIDFWATWCGPCVRELPNVKQAWNRYKDKGLELVDSQVDRVRRSDRIVCLHAVDEALVEIGVVATSVCLSRC